MARERGDRAASNIADGRWPAELLAYAAGVIDRAASSRPAGRNVRRVALHLGVTERACATPSELADRRPDGRHVSHGNRSVSPNQTTPSRVVQRIATAQGPESEGASRVRGGLGRGNGGSPS